MEHLHRLDDGVWELLRRAGLREVFIGFESGYQPSLDAMGKGASVNHILKCTRSCAEHDVDLRGSFMVGIPGIDTKTEIAHTFEMMNRMIDIFHEKSDLAKLDFLLSFFVPYPSTPLYQKCMVGFPQLNSLEEWGDFDQFDFHTPWVSDSYYMEWLSASCTLKGSAHGYPSISIFGSAHRAHLLTSQSRRSNLHDRAPPHLFYI